MEIEKTEKVELPVQTLEEKLPIAGKGLNQKGNFIIILGVVFIILIAGVGRYLYLSKQKNVNTSTNVSQNNPLPTTNNTQDPDNTNPVAKQTKYSFLRDGDIWVSDNGNQKKITDYKHNSFPVLSHDSQKIAYLSTPEETVKQIEDIEKAGGILGGLGPGYNIWVINFDGSNAKKLTSSSIAYPEIQFSPNDEYISFISPYDNRIIVLGAENGKQILNVKMKGSASIHKNHIWDSDSQNIFIAESVSGTQTAQYSGVSVYKVNLSTQAVTQVSSIPSGNNNFSKIEYSISPDLKKLAYFTEVQRVISWGVSEYDWGYYIADLNGSNVQEVLSKKSAKIYHGPNIYFSWSPDSRYIAFFNEQGSDIATTMHVYDVQMKKLFNVFESESSLAIWDRNNNLYMKKFVRNVGFEKDLSNVDFKTGQTEKFLENANSLNFGY